MKIAKLESAHADAYRSLMLGGYESAPEAFTATLEERRDKPLSWWRERFTGQPQAACTVFGAFEGERLVGVVGLRQAPRPKTRHKATLFGLYVHPDAAGRGVGRRLVEAVLEEARGNAAIRAVQLTVTESNEPALRLYASCGFERFGIEPMAIRTGERFLAKVHMWCPVDRSGSPLKAAGEPVGSR